MTSARVPAALLVAGATAAAAALVLPWSNPTGDPGRPCAALAALADAMDLASVSDQAQVRVRAAVLADALSTRAGATGDVSDQEVARQLLVLLDDPGATVADLFEVVAPLARDCRIELPGTAPTP